METQPVDARDHVLDLARIGDRQRAEPRFHRRHGFVEAPHFLPCVDSRTSSCMQRELA